MTPIFKQPSYDSKEEKSYVFHRDKRGEVVATFHGPNHWQDAREFCAKYGQDDGSQQRKDGDA